MVAGKQVKGFVITPAIVLELELVLVALVLPTLLLNLVTHITLKTHFCMMTV